MKTSLHRRSCAQAARAFAGVVLAAIPAISMAQGFRVEESTVGGIHAAIKEGQITCKSLVQAYIDRARAYNGVCTQLVTKDGTPLDYGRMEFTASDPSVKQQYGMVAGIPNAGQLNALETINIRGS